ncbi:SRPBCC domain-containing protein [Rudaea sp.]|uniref:SRPBCC family protein n=1 Tax=Rudaea sp. TaxID=2136325 RepID=UPI002ED14BA4
MSRQSFNSHFLVDRSPEEVFDAINDVRAWWSGDIEGDTDKLGATFRYRYENMHDSTQTVTELVPGKKVAWHVTDGHLAFVEDQRGWKDTDIVFEIVRKGRKTELRFTHVGLEPGCECYAACAEGWDAVINGNLRQRIVTGAAQPNPFDEAA